MDKKEFTQQLALVLMPKILDNYSAAYPGADEENHWAQFIVRLAAKIYKKGEFTDLSK